MSDEAQERRLEARRLMAEACAMYADSWEATEAGVITGYVGIFEIVPASGGDPHLLWITGNGDTPQDTYTGGLPSWRVEGMVRHAIRDIIVGNTSTDH